jgi:NAD(P)-dependent dehydrogenase (short-subunit alcohol dehydrogenase family)
MDMANMTGKVCLVTGANSGIGKAAAMGLARLGATVVMVCRSPERGEKAQIEIIGESGNRNVDLLIADLSSQGSVRKLAGTFVNKYSELHVLVNNAGAIPDRRRLTVDGIETQFAVNQLAPFLLTNLLLDVLKATASARVVTLSSQVHSKSPLDFDDLQSEQTYSASQVYRKAKLANILFTYELARRLEGAGVTANCLHPGVIATRLLDNYMGLSGKAGFGSGNAAGDTPEQGGDAVLYLAASPEVEGVSGKYFFDNVARESAPISYDENQARRLWEISAELTGLPSG